MSAAEQEGLLRARESVWRAFFTEEGKKVIRLEYPETKLQRIGDVAILYTTYLYELENSRNARYKESGLGTEIFVLRNGTWINSGWNLQPDKK